MKSLAGSTIVRFWNKSLLALSAIALGGCCGLGGSSSSSSDPGTSSPPSVTEGNATEKEAIATDKCLSSGSESACARCCKDHGVSNHVFFTGSCVCVPSK